MHHYRSIVLFFNNLPRIRTVSENPNENGHYDRLGYQGNSFLKTLRTASKGKGKLHNPFCSISVTVRLIDGFRINFLVSALVDRYLT